MEHFGTDFYCDVALKDTASLQKEYESNHVLAYHHTRPHWPVHIVVVSKKHITSFTEIAPEDTAIISEIIEVLKIVAKRIEKEHGDVRIVTNIGSAHTQHLHFHIGSGEPLNA